MGKTPLLPLYAAALGAGDVLLGFIVSVSTLTGMFTKPLVGLLSDRWGRRSWLLVGTAFFVLMPFVYRFVSSPDQLVAVRIVHGMATAIYGPVTLAYVAEMSSAGRAERLAWFSVARNAGYIVGPLAAGLMLLTMDPVSVFTVIGLLSAAAFIPVLTLKEPTRRQSPSPPSLVVHAVRGLWSGGRTPAVWLAGGLEGANYVALYAVRAFLPLQALSLGMNVAVAGTFFAVQEAFHLVLNPLGGRVGDRLGHRTAVSLGMGVMGAGLATLTLAESFWALMAPAVLLGAGQALVFPSTVALVSDQVDRANLGLGMGLVGTLRNAGKVAGPVAGGLLIAALGFSATFALTAAALVLAASSLGIGSRALRRRRTAEQTANYGVASR